MIKSKPASLSENGHYIVAQYEPLRLYVHPKDADQPHYCTAELDSVQYNGTKYVQYQPVRRFLRDCLHTAEEIIYDGPLDLGGDYTHVKGVPFGRSDAENIRIANARRGQENADGRAHPDYSEAYVIVSTAAGSTYPYHAAAVVAIDGDDTVTLEVFARGTDARQNDRSAAGRFEMYSSTGPTSFHATWSNNVNFTGTNPVTMVLGRYH
ncbi:hypothetical protein [Actinomadura nitritigenes]|uniref:hypothetical protein n=1 Tax=Actinomadura nitritigenes TaxID=134602 RepID=UPI003D92526B